jgi:alpha-tubulin suppressor-like RCC1 family protein
MMFVGCGAGRPIVGPVPPVPLCVGSSIAAGDSTTWLRQADGTVWRWGEELGGDSSPDHLPRRVDWAFGALDLQQRKDQACVLSSTHELRCGDAVQAVTTTAPSATEVERISVGIATEYAFPSAQQDCVQKRDGSVWCWPAEVAQDYLKAEGAVEQVELGRDVLQLALQVDQGCAIKANGSVWCWGRGYLGDGHAPYGHGETDPAQPPRQVALAGPARTIASTTLATCVGLENGDVYCFGLLDGEGVVSPRKVEIADVKTLTAGRLHFCGLTTAGRVWCWGSNEEGVMGRDPYAAFDEWIPRQIGGLPAGVATVVSGYRDVCAGGGDGSVWCWGGNLLGQVAPGEKASYLVEPREVRGCR